jgi:hypothetical protein
MIDLSWSTGMARFKPRPVSAAARFCGRAGIGLLPRWQFPVVVTEISQMIIRREQMQALGQAALRAFEDEMVVHLADFSPPLFRAVKEDQLRIAIRLGIARAGEYGITFRGPIRLYLELMLLFGSHFDTDPQYPWATEILKDQAHGLQMQRAERLRKRANIAKQSPVQRMRTR